MRKFEAETNELFVELGKLDRASKLRAIEYLAQTLAAEEANNLAPRAVYEVWSPFDSAGTANDLMKMLAEVKESGSG